MTHSGKATVTLPTDEQILIVREFDAPPELVYRAYTEPELVSRWWPGKRGEMRSCEIDLRVGGRWRFVMEHRDGFEVAFNGEYRELVPGERIVSTELFEGLPEGVEPIPSVNTLTLTPLDGDRTRMEVLVQHHSREYRDGHVGSGMEGGMQESLDALEQVARSLLAQ